MNAPISGYIPHDIKLNDAADYAEIKFMQQGFLVESCDVVIHKTNNLHWPLKATAEYWIKRINY